MNHSIDNRNVTTGQWLLALLAGLGLTLAVWHSLCTGGGFVGGDTYTYFMPQKNMLSDALARGELPLWHNLTGLGYPLHAESQAGVFYPTNQILYRLFDVNQACNVSIILHYWLAFVFAWRFARCQNLSTWPSMLAAVVYVYGWFPARISLEWSIIGGVWLPLTLWLTDEFLRRPRRRCLALLSLCLGMHLLAGHFTLAFINQLTIVAYALLKFVWRERGDGAATPPNAVTSQVAGINTLWIVGAIAAGLIAAAVQLLPTFELKQASQRGSEIKEFDPAYGHMPPVYATQLVASWWYWHTPEIRASRQMLNTPGAIAADTNAVEAHIYLGLIPLLLILMSVNVKLVLACDRITFRIWMILASLGLLYATGWLMPITRHLPGFSYFMGPARYTILTALGGGLLSGLILDRLTFRLPSIQRVLLTVAIIAITMVDLSWSSEPIADAVVVERPPIENLKDSWLKQTLQQNQESHAEPNRLLAPGPNVGNLFQVSCVPQYLGIGPAVYYTAEMRPPTGPQHADETFPSPDTSRQLRSLGVTHILTLNPLEHPSDEIELVNQYPDSYLNAVWGRGSDFCFLYRFTSPPRRITATPETAVMDTQWKTSTASHVQFEIELNADALVTLRELMYPGWEVQIDGVPAEAVTAVHAMRSVNVPAGRHVVDWHFRSQSFTIGAAVSIIFGCLLLALIAWPKRRTSANVTPG